MKSACFHFPFFLLNLFAESFKANKKNGTVAKNKKRAKVKKSGKCEMKFTAQVEGWLRNREERKGKGYKIFLNYKELFKVYSKLSRFYLCLFEGDWGSGGGEKRNETFSDIFMEKGK